ncbi:MAG: DUF2020 domain-containing protein [Nakamurella sp.]
MTGRGRARRRARRTALWPALIFGCLAACSPGTDTADPPASTAAVSTETITTGTITTGVSATVTSTIPGATILAVPPAQTSEPAPVDGTCPYLSDDDVADINGQHTGTTQVVEVSPHPICLFYRSDGGFLASVRVIQADTAQAAVAAVNAHVPIENSNPANQPPGWAGGSKVTDTGSVYAVSKDSIAVVAETNQQQSIKGRQLVVATVGALGL